MFGLSFPLVLLASQQLSLSLANPQVESSLDTPQGAIPIGHMQHVQASEPDAFTRAPVPTQLGDKILYVNFDGADMNRCASGPANNCSSLFNGTVAPFSGDSSSRAAIIQIVRGRVEDFGITVTDQRPQSGDYDMEMVGDWVGVPSPGFAGVAPGPLDCFDRRGGQVSFTLDVSPRADGIAEIILQEVAHTWGLEHIDDTGDLLYPTTQGSNKVFKDECLTIVRLEDNGQTTPDRARCNEMHTRFCAADEQNSYREMLELFGPGIPDTNAPLIEIVEPTEAAQLDADAVTLRIALEDDQSPAVIDTQITIAGDGLPEPIEASGAYAAPDEIEFPINGLPPGSYRVRVEGSDEAENPASDAVTFSVRAPDWVDDAPDSGTDASGDTAADTEPDATPGAIPSMGGGGLDADGVDDIDSSSGCGCTTAPIGGSLLYVFVLFVARRRRGLE